MKHIKKIVCQTLILLLCALPSKSQGRRPPWKESKVNAVIDGSVQKNIRVLMIDDASMVSIQTIKKIFGGKTKWKRVSRCLIYMSHGRTAEFGLDLSKVVISGKPVDVFPAVRAWGNDVYFPMDLLNTPEFQSLVSCTIQWKIDGKILTIDAAPEVASPRFYSYPRKSRVSVDVGPHVDFYVLSKKNDTLKIRLPGGRARDWEKISIEDGVIKSVEVDPASHWTDLVVTLSSNSDTPDVYLQESPRSLIVEIDKEKNSKNLKNEKLDVKIYSKKNGNENSKKNDGEKKSSEIILPKETVSAPVLAPPLRPKPRADIEAPYLALSPLRTIVIDPGHGGKDAGAIGPNGTLEKDINLQMALSLAKLLNDEGRFKVILTRSNDTFVTLQERSAIANKIKADLFISLHCNAAVRRESGGFEVYFLSEKASDDEAAAVARRENAVLEMEGFFGKTRQELEGLLWSLARNEHMNESSAIAGDIALQVSKRLNLLNRGVKQAGFYVLRGTSMPAILVESAFITHPKEEGMLRSARFHRKFVDALYAGLLDYEKKKIHLRLRDAFKISS